jgi:hypothetical protein
VTIPVLANDSDPNGDPLTVTAVTQGTFGGVVINAGTTVTYTPSAGFAGTDTFQYTVSDGRGLSAQGLVTVVVAPAEVLTVTAAQFKGGEWRVEGTSTANGATITVHSGSISGAVVGTSPVTAGTWRVRLVPNPAVALSPTNNPIVTVESTGGALPVTASVRVR